VFCVSKFFAVCDEWTKKKARTFIYRKSSHDTIQNNVTRVLVFEISFDILSIFFCPQYQQGFNSPSVQNILAVMDFYILLRQVLLPEL
jgi:hypothetical protein